MIGKRMDIMMDATMSKSTFRMTAYLAMARIFFPIAGINVPIFVEVSPVPMKLHA